jgi:hypothetical protein
VLTTLLLWGEIPQSKEVFNELAKEAKILGLKINEYKTK